MNLIISDMGDIYAAVMGRMLSRYMFMSMFALTIVLAVAIMWLLTRHWYPRDRYEIDVD
jgi:hypothetical protein